MHCEIQPFSDRWLSGCLTVWNEVVEAGNAFPQVEPLTCETGKAFFEGQSFTGVAVEAGTGEVVGLYILHPNNVGRCGHLCNASYAVRGDRRGRGLGEALVRHCLKTAKEIGFGVLQFNAVVATNAPALRLYEKLGFVRLGVIPNGFLLPSGEYADIIPHFRPL